MAPVHWPAFVGPRESLARVQCALPTNIVISRYVCIAVGFTPLGKGCFHLRLRPQLIGSSALPLTQMSFPRRNREASGLADHGGVLWAAPREASSVSAGPESGIRPLCRVCRTSGRDRPGTSFCMQCRCWTCPVHYSLFTRRCHLCILRRSSAPGERLSLEGVSLGDQH